MSCWLCGHDKKDAHHLGCARIYRPNLTIDEAVGEGLLAAPPEAEKAPKPNTEVLKEGTMTTVPEDDDEPDKDEQKSDVGECEFKDCHNPKYSDSPRTKYCEEHKDPKNRKE